MPNVQQLTLFRDVLQWTLSEWIGVLNQVDVQLTTEQDPTTLAELQTYRAQLDEMIGTMTSEHAEIVNALGAPPPDPMTLTSPSKELLRELAEFLFAPVAPEESQDEETRSLARLEVARTRFPTAVQLAGL